MYTDSSDKTLQSNKILSIFSGFCFGAAWLVFIDAVVVSYKIDKCKVYEWIGGIAGSIGLFLVENLPHDMFAKSKLWQEDTQCYQKFLLILSTFLLFGAIVSSVVIFVVAPHFKNATNDLVKFRGWGAILQCFLILVSAYSWRFMWRDPQGY